MHQHGSRWTIMYTSRRRHVRCGEIHDYWRNSYHQSPLKKKKKNSPSSSWTVYVPAVTFCSLLQTCLKFKRSTFANATRLFHSILTDLIAEPIFYFILFYFCLSRRITKNGIVQLYWTVRRLRRSMIHIKFILLSNSIQTDWFMVK